MPARRRARVVLGLTLAGVVLTAACSGSTGGGAAVTSAPNKATFPEPATADPCGPGGGLGGSPEPPAGQPPATGAAAEDPYAAEGARQRPGPDMTTTLPPRSPVSAVVAIPPNPDLSAAAAQPDGKPAATTTQPDVPDGQVPQAPVGQSDPCSVAGDDL